MQHSNQKLSFRYALLCLIGVGIIFYSTYGLSNWLAEQRTFVPEIVFKWEKNIPFLPWTIVPYWSLNLFYALAFFLCKTRQQLYYYIKQLLLAQLIAVTFFVCFPLQFSWAKPLTDGVAGSLFTSLAAFDQPFNQAPSLHIMLTLIVGRFYWSKLSPFGRIIWEAWLGLIALSVLTTYQHHFFDIPTGLCAGALVLWLFPSQIDYSLLHSRIHFKTKHHLIVATIYFILAIISALFACLGGLWLWCLWISIATFIVAICYLFLGAKAWQKLKNGHHSFAITLLTLPYLIGVRVNMWYWLRGEKRSVALTEQLYIGSILDAQNFSNIVDVCAEYSYCYSTSRHKIENYLSFPMLDMVPADATTLVNTSEALESLLHRSSKPILLCCALGYGRSVAVMLTWMVRYGEYCNLDEAISTLKQIRPKMVLSETMRQQILLASNLGK